ncbi:protein kinase [bacterium]|nr:protein kinase [bacterium]
MQIKNFQVIKSLERNTLSELFLGRHVHENYYVKIRLYDQLSITNEEVREAILQRLRNSYQMRHRNIIATLDYGVEGRYMYQIQEHMDYGTLEDLMEKASTIPPEIAAFILQEILRGLQYAHSIGIFHGMLNPAKVLLAVNGIVKIDDFQFLDLKNTFLKQVQTRIKRKQQMYLAPEHLLGKEADYRCDLFSAGVIAYRMLTGQHPFLEEKSEWTTMQITACNAKLLFELDPTLPAPLEEMVDRMIEKELNKRAQNAEDALQMIDAYVDHFGEVRTQEVLANFLKKPAQSVEQLNVLRAEEYAQQADQFQLQEQWDRAIIALSRAQFLRPKDKAIENELKSLRTRLGYSHGEQTDPKIVQLEQSLRANPENIQILQRLATLAKSSGDLVQCVCYYKRILKLAPADTFAATQIRQILQTQDKDTVLSPNDSKWVRWQDFYRMKERPIWQTWSALQGNLVLLVFVIAMAIGIAVLHIFRLMPIAETVSAESFQMKTYSSQIVANQKINGVCNQAVAIYKQGEIEDAIEILSKTPLVEKGASAAKARLLLARYWLELDHEGAALKALEEIDLPSADFAQKIAAYKLKAEAYRRQKRYGHAIDQYINIKALPGLPVAMRDEADKKIEVLQNEALPSPQGEDN